MAVVTFLSKSLVKLGAEAIVQKISKLRIANKDQAITVEFILWKEENSEAYIRYVGCNTNIIDFILFVRTKTGIDKYAIRAEKRETVAGWKESVLHAILTAMLMTVKGN